MPQIDAASVIAALPVDAAGASSRVLNRVTESILSLRRLVDEKGLDHWVVMFSGGKDSTTSLLVAIEAIRQGAAATRLDVVLADTLVEIPTVAQYARQFLDELAVVGLTINKHLVTPDIEQSFWVCMLGRGYPPPHRNFRWCTTKLKMKPAEVALGHLIQPGRTVFITGVRFGESDARDIRLHAACSRGGECGQGLWFERSGRFGATYAGPISLWRECDVWDFLNYVAPSWGHRTDQLSKLYLFPTMRFGCWTCTVVRRDKAMEGICKTPGGERYLPLVRFRDLLIETAGVAENRVTRPNGAKGRLSLAARRELLTTLLDVQERVGFSLISDAELDLIKKHWGNGQFGDSY